MKKTIVFLLIFGLNAALNLSALTAQNAGLTMQKIATTTLSPRLNLPKVQHPNLTLQQTPFYYENFVAKDLGNPLNMHYKTMAPPNIRMSVSDIFWNSVINVGLNALGNNH